MSNLTQYTINAAAKYLAHLEENNLGTEEIKIASASMRGDTLRLVLEQNLYNTDYLELHIADIAIDIDSIDSKSYDNLSRVLLLTFEENRLQSYIDKVAKEYGINITNDNLASCLRLIADLKFLVKNIKSFFENTNDLRITLPTTKPIELKIPLPPYINKEQQEAIRGVFANSISYIWGISGSGKTQVVLFSCLYNIIMQNKKALILAPTNTALEQIFTALINKCDAKGISRRRFLRMGMPSIEFLERYPEVCLHKDDEEGKEDSSRLFYSDSLKDRLKDSLVVGITLDSFVKRYETLASVNFCHIFLDECAFSPLIKLIAPLNRNIPITLLGDHKQLMPICQMDERQIKSTHNEVSIWNLNALFLENFLQNPSTLHHANNHDDIAFKNIAHFRLTTTHRYGNNLAKILDNYVYRNNLIGVGEETQIYFVDSRLYGNAYDYNSRINENIGEANAISMINSRFKDYAVLTPFRDQQKLLISKKVPRSRVFTIHKSQGKEFDTIIFSPVKFSPYMTNSSNKAALFALNVAISRLKKELILVCDYNFWINKRGQLISALLQIARPYDMGR